MAKLGVFGGVVAGIAWATMPPASTDGFAPVDVATVRVTEIRPVNVPISASLVLSGMGGRASVAAAADSFAGAREHDVNAQFAIVVYGEGQISAGSTCFGPCNDAAAQFLDGDNFLPFAIRNGGDQIDFGNAADYLFGSDAAIAADPASDSAWDYAENGFRAAVSDMGDYLTIEL